MRNIITWYGTDNPMDGMVLDVLLRKHESIRKSLGISVPIPEDSDKVMQTLIQGLLLHSRSVQSQTSLLLPGMEDYLAPEKKRLAAEWDVVAREEEKRSRTLFAQQSIPVPGQNFDAVQPAGQGGAVLHREDGGRFPLAPGRLDIGGGAARQDFSGKRLHLPLKTAPVEVVIGDGLLPFQPVGDEDGAALAPGYLLGNGGIYWARQYGKSNDWRDAAERNCFGSGSDRIRKV